MDALPLTAAAAHRATARSFRHAVPALLLLALTVSAAFTLSGSFGTVQEAAKAELGLSDYRLSLLQGVAAAVPMILLSVPIGVAVDRRRRVSILIALALLSVAGTALTAAVGSFAPLFLARMMTAVGMTGAVTAALSIAADLCAPEQRGRATLIVTLGKIVGQAAGFALTGALFAGAMPGWLADVAPWRGSHWLLAAMGAILVLPLFALREPARREVAVASRAPLLRVAAELWARRAFLGPLFLGQVSIVMADAAALIWAAPVLTRSYGLQPGDFSGWMGAVLLVTGILGSVLGGVAADVGQRRRGRGGLLLGAVLAAALGIPAALFPVSGSVGGFAALFGLLMLSGTVTGLVMSVALTVYLPNELRGVCIGAFLALAGLIGFGIAPTLVAGVSDLLGGEAELGPALALVGTIVGILGFAGFWLAMRRVAASEPI